ncbi:rhamnosyltransferase [Oenococcus oeni ATCC BAA-1163]|mgnify:CR=1 FL=1|uniref:Rhamnosyltransferase n=1 Tax=Oenococcus oeni ATCC BAA-1163 TaxID=379360 RepID=A0NKF0_OENOE|nr:glycosyltransferase family 2 protein [Oenococcus oeni]EAV39003.1 rhamnosyltransferase [Oenococcus oeni ATCC BAA-1163]KDP19785.1 hypothetical protein EL27_04220 [Oenococcus oeni]
MKLIKKVAILMSTYNGEKYISCQLDSVINQKNDSNFELTIYIRDDGSTDSTLKIIKEYARKYPRKIIYLNSKENLGPKKSFFHLMNCVDSDFYFFCDQDDYWLDNKVDSALIQLDSIKKIPALYYGSMIQADRNLKKLGVVNKKNYPENFVSSLNETLASGLTIAFNSSLMDIFREKYNKLSCNNIIMHDSWMYLLASAFGKVIFDSAPHVLYRQHSSNVVGTTGNNLFKKIFKIREIFNKFYKNGLFKKQANELLKNYGECLSKEKRNAINIFLSSNRQLKEVFWILKKIKIKNRLLAFLILISIFFKKY